MKFNKKADFFFSADENYPIVCFLIAVFSLELPKSPKLTKYMHPQKLKNATMAYILHSILHGIFSNISDYLVAFKGRKNIVQQLGKDWFWRKLGESFQTYN